MMKMATTLSRLNTHVLPVVAWTLVSGTVLAQDALRVRQPTAVWSTSSQSVMPPLQLGPPFQRPQATEPRLLDLTEAGLTQLMERVALPTNTAGIYFPVVPTKQPEDGQYDMGALASFEARHWDSAYQDIAALAGREVADEIYGFRALYGLQLIDLAKVTAIIPLRRVWTPEQLAKAILAAQYRPPFDPERSQIRSPAHVMTTLQAQVANSFTPAAASILRPNSSDGMNLGVDNGIGVLHVDRAFDPLGSHTPNPSAPAYVGNAATHPAVR
jgi:hypothetical protein